MGKNISENRKAGFYIGTGIMIIGYLMFFSVFLTFMSGSGDSSSMGSAFMFRGGGGMVLVAFGAFLRNVATKGLAGSGVILDPEQARDDLEPYSRMAGGMVKDAMDEADLDFKGKTEKVIMVRCQHCSKLNEEDSKFCQECGKKI